MKQTGWVNDLKRNVQIWGQAHRLCKKYTTLQSKENISKYIYDSFLDLNILINMRSCVLMLNELLWCFEAKSFFSNKAW